VKSELCQAQKELSIKQSTGRIHEQTRLLMQMLKTAYQQIQGTHTDTNFGFSASVLYNKKYCILAVICNAQCPNVPNSLKIKFILEGYKLAHLCSF
jgi:hypothetical protein